MKSLILVCVAGLTLLTGCGSSDSSSGNTSPGDTFVPLNNTGAASTTDNSVTDNSQVTAAEADQLGQEICADLRNGMTQAQAWDIFKTVGMTPDQGAAVMAAAIQDYCPDQAP